MVTDLANWKKLKPKSADDKRRGSSKEGIHFIMQNPSAVYLCK